MASLEEVSQYALDAEDRERLFALQRVCSVCWSTSDGWPVGVTHRYLWARGSIWVTTSSQRHRVMALRRRPKSCVIISGDGTELGPDRTMTPAGRQGLVAMLDTPRRVVLELTPVKIISYDGMKLAEAIAREGVTSG
jgi:hypothetical protein